MVVNQAGQTTRRGIMLWVAGGGLRLAVFATVGAEHTPVASYHCRAVPLSKHEVDTNFVSCRPVFVPAVYCHEPK
jgi:hypothetical protein